MLLEWIAGIERHVFRFACSGVGREIVVIESTRAEAWESGRSQRRLHHCNCEPERATPWPSMTAKMLHFLQFEAGVMVTTVR